MTKITPDIILVRPQMGENIGAAARAMLNFSLHNLKLVAPRDGWPNQVAVNMSSGAMDIMPPVQIFETLPEALHDCHYVYATTSRRRDMVKPELKLHEAVADAKDKVAQKQKTAFIFGPERTGLSNDDLSLCHAVVTVPTNPEFPSLNLAQSVLLVAHEWLNEQEGNANKQDLDMGDSFPVTHEKLEEFFLRLEEELEKGNFFRAEELKPTMIRNIRNIFMRKELSDQELRTLHGMLSALIGNKRPPL